VLLFLGKNIMRFYKKDDLKKLREMQEQQHQQYATLDMVVKRREIMLLKS